jgi:hypothetical protein
MANEFIIKNGFQSKGNSQITGSLDVTGGITGSFTGSFTGDGSGLSGVPATAFPFVGDAVITGSLIVSGSSLNSGFRTDTRNIILGYGAGNNQDPTNGPYNVMIGFEAGYTNTIGDSNVCLGQYAGYALSTNASDENVFIGKLAGAGGTSPVARMSDANWNIGLGNESLLFLTSGDYNIGFGHRSLRNISSGQQNIALGRSALNLTATGDNNIGIGYRAGGNQTTGDGNITIGSGSLGVAGESNQLRIGHADLAVISASLTTGDIIFPSTASAAYFVGDGSNITGVISSSYAITASHALNAGGGSTFPFVGDAVITGSLTISGSFSAFRVDSNNIVLGEGAALNMNSNADNNVILGTQTAGGTGTTSGDGNVAIGHQAGFNLSTGGNNVLVGLEAGKLLDNDSSNVFLGTYSGRYQKIAGTSISIGYNALQGGNSGGSTSTGNVAIGYRAGEVVNGAIYNNIMGFVAGVALSTGDYNTLIGYYAGSSITSGNGNIIIGSGSTGEAAISNQLINYNISFIRDRRYYFC